jgi:hypothetical protein
MRTILIFLILSAISASQQTSNPTGGGVTNNPGAGGGGSVPTGVANGSALVSNGVSQPPVYQTKATIDVRDTAGIDCTGNTDSSTALNTIFGAISNKKLIIPAGCQLRADSALTIQGQSAFIIEGEGERPDINGGPSIFGCNGVSGPLLTINRSGYGRLTGFGVYPHGVNAICASSSFTESIRITNSGAPGVTSTQHVIDHMGFTPNVQGGTIANYIGIRVFGAPNQEHMIFRDNWFNCQNSTGSIGIDIDPTASNSDNNLAEGNSIAACFQGIATNGNIRIVQNHMNNGAFSVFGANGANIFIGSCISGPVNIFYNEASDGSGPFINSNNDSNGGCNNGENLIGNEIGISDLGANQYPVNLGTSGGKHILIGNTVYITSAVATTKSVVGSSSQAACAAGPIGTFVDIANVNAFPAKSGGWSGCVAGPDFQSGHTSAYPKIDVRDFGAVPDGSTDNSTAIADAFIASKFVTTGLPTVFFGCNGVSAACQYNYGGSGISPINPLIPTAIVCENSTLNYTGTTHAADLGPTNLTKGDERQYSIEGCRFTGGASETQGIFLNNFLINVRISKNHFYNFGNTTGATINYTGNNWELIIDDNFFTSADGNGPRNEIDGHTASNSTLHMTGNIMACLSATGTACSVSGQGYGIWTTNTAFIINNEIKFHQPLIRISSCVTCGSGTGFYVIANVLEGNTSDPGPAITFGDPNTAGSTVSVGGVIADNNIFWPGASGVPIVGPEPASSSSFNLSSVVFEDNQMTPTPSGGAVYVKTNVGLNNRSIHNTGATSGSDLIQSSSPAFFDGQEGTFGMYWYQTSFGSFAWFLQSPQSAINSTTDYAMEAQSGVTRLNTKSGSTGLIFSIDNVDKWKIDPTTFNFGPIGTKGQHFTTQAAQADSWGVATCSTNTVTVTFTTAYTSTPAIIVSDETAAGGARVSAKSNSAFTITCTGASDVVDYFTGGNPN